MEYYWFVMNDLDNLYSETLPHGLLIVHGVPNVWETLETLAKNSGYVPTGWLYRGGANFWAMEVFQIGPVQPQFYICIRSQAKQEG